MQPAVLGRRGCWLGRGGAWQPLGGGSCGTPPVAAAPQRWCLVGDSGTLLTKSSASAEASVTSGKMLT